MILRKFKKINIRGLHKNICIRKRLPIIRDSNGNLLRNISNNRNNRVIYWKINSQINKFNKINKNRRNSKWNNKIVKIIYPNNFNNRQQHQFSPNKTFNLKI